MSEIREFGERPDGRKIRGYEVDFETIIEDFAVYTLSDGSRLRVKHTLLKVYRIVDENNKGSFDENGDPEVFINGTIVVISSKPKGAGDN